MPILKSAESQVISLVDQLSSDEKCHVLDHLLFEKDNKFASACKIGEQAFKKTCGERGLNPDNLSEDEKLSLVDEILHEDD